MNETKIPGQKLGVFIFLWQWRKTLVIYSPLAYNIPISWKTAVDSAAKWWDMIRYSPDRGNNSDREMKKDMKKAPGLPSQCIFFKIAVEISVCRPLFLLKRIPNIRSKVTALNLHHGFIVSSFFTFVNRYWLSLNCSLCVYYSRMKSFFI